VWIQSRPMHQQPRILPLGIAFLFLLGVAFELYRYFVGIQAGHPDRFFAGMAVAFGCAAVMFLVIAFAPKRDLKPTEQGGAFRFKLRTLLLWLAIVPAIVGLGYVYRDWLADLFIDEWLMRGIP
jgi:phosphatidylserine synthase